MTDRAEPDILAVIPALRKPPLTAANLAERRAARVTEFVLSDAVERTDHVVSADVTVRVHRARNAAGPLPCLYYIHGGGYVTGSHLDLDPVFDRWCPMFGCVGVAVQYRLAPEIPYPGPLEDCYAGLRWVHEHAGELGVDPAKTGIGGASAGGGLAAGLALLARDRGEVPVAFQLLIYPMLDDRQVTPSSRADVPLWVPDENRFGWVSYLGDRYGTEDVPPYAAAARATDLVGLPSAFVLVGTLDAFLDEDVDYAMRLAAAGVLTDLHVFGGGPHGFDSQAPETMVARRAQRTLEDWLATRLR
jgi:acetyl esterase/lipase